MPNEVHVTTSHADAAKMIVERNHANGKPAPRRSARSSGLRCIPRRRQGTGGHTGQLKGAIEAGG
jgi:hypothetical protein